MGFCLLSNVAIAAAALAEQGERVIIVDIDAHHGNGTQDVFYADGRVLYVSLHQWPLYPGTGAVTETGIGLGELTTVNVPLPPGTTSSAYLQAIDDVVLPAAARFGPTWLLISAGFDGHRDDPITDLGLTTSDYSAVVRRLLPIVPPGRRLAMLEGGYDLTALRHCSEALIAALAGIELSELADASTGDEAPTSGDVGRREVERVCAHWRGLLG
jgi:acetoin utilization deacetylase AcuC-like enzyme